MHSDVTTRTFAVKQECYLCMHELLVLARLASFDAIMTKNSRCLKVTVWLLILRVLQSLGCHCYSLY